MSTDIGSDIQQLIQEGNAALRVGEMFEARQLFRRATEQEPHNSAAWLGLATAVRPFAEKREAFEHVLALEPDNEEARIGLAYVEKKIADGEVMALPERRERRAFAPPQPAPPQAAAPVGTAVEVEYCYRHPDRETGLHCSICNRPICTQCAMPGPVGQICPECARARRPRNYQVNAGSIIIGALVAFVVTIPIAVLVAMFIRGFLLLFMLAIGPAIAEVIVRAVERTTKMKRGRPMQIAVGLAIGIGCAVTFLFVPNVFTLLIFAFFAISTAVARLR